MTSFSDQPQRAVGSGSLNRSSSSPRTLFNNVMNGVIFILGALALLPLLLVLSYLLIKGFSSLSLDLFT
ncbi:MAG: phosphate ABC transporter, permease protein PstA, partial [Rivularia sp. (in: cyanobacteria)]